ncbi:hypothetical protein DH2020_005687 [Rehmannia glutinosa]|uniref:F-box domain-containing protein n=1 Tax=Rehmannia glutinosa TaxID=99300 RepID=A0ABR0XGP5_REHGL
MAGHCVSVKRRTRPYYFRRCKRMTLTNIEPLPDDMVFKILLQLPAQDIYNVARFVCRDWYHMIHSHNFINAHLQHSTSGLLIQDLITPISSSSPIFVAMSRGRIEISKFSYKFRNIVLTSCNGLVVQPDFNNRHALYVANPATEQHFALPPFYQPILLNTYYGLAYVPSCMEYKVVHPYDCQDGDASIRCAILTVGVDDYWRHVQIEHLFVSARKLLIGTPLITEGFMHWCGYRRNFLVTLNLETETIRQILVPQSCGERLTYYLSTGSYLSLITVCRRFLWEVWELKPDTGEWTKLPNIDLEAQKCTLEHLSCKRDFSLQPVGWIKYKEVLLFRVFYPSRICIAYKVCTQEMESFELNSDYVHSYVVHTNSLVSLGGC